MLGAGLPLLRTVLAGSELLLDTVLKAVSVSCRLYLKISRQKNLKTLDSGLLAAQHIPWIHIAVEHTIPGQSR